MVARLDEKTLGPEESDRKLKTKMRPLGVYHRMEECFFLKMKGIYQLSRQGQ
jgi:hypothetical protein